MFLYIFYMFTIGDNRCLYSLLTKALHHLQVTQWHHEKDQVDAEIAQMDGPGRNKPPHAILQQTHSHNHFQADQPPAEPPI